MGSIETKRVKDALQLQFTAIRTQAARLSAEDLDELETDLVELERGVADLRGIVGSLPHLHRRPVPAGVPAASPATSHPEREAKGSETADGTQRQDE